MHFTLEVHYICRYNFSDFAVQANHLPPELLAVLPPTDSRLRKDVRAIEEGRWTAVTLSVPRPFHSLHPGAFLTRALDQRVTQ